MALLPWQKGIIEEIIQETADTRRFRVSIPGISQFDFKPGQFVTLDLPIHEKANKRWRSYSIASAPDGSNRFELIIVLDKQGLGTNYLFHEVKPGTELTFRGPQGVFLLKEQPEKQIFLICTGTGIAPFRSMLLNEINLGKDCSRFHLIFGCRHQSDLLYFEELKALSLQHGFKYFPALSRETWEGKTGYVHAIYEELCANKPDAAFYLCGWRGMIDEARERIVNMGYDKIDVHFEIYG